MLTIVITVGVASFADATTMTSYSTSTPSTKWGTIASTGSVGILEAVSDAFPATLGSSGGGNYDASHPLQYIETRMDQVVLTHHDGSPRKIILSFAFVFFALLSLFSSRRLCRKSVILREIPVCPDIPRFPKIRLCVSGISLGVLSFFSVILVAFRKN